jgi:hypothetical protein
LSEPNEPTTVDPAGTAPIAPDTTPDTAPHPVKTADSPAPFWKRWLGKA